MTSEIRPAQFPRKSSTVRSRHFIKALMKARLIYWSDPRRSIKALMTARLICGSARSVPWAGEEALALTEDKTRPAVTYARGHQNPPPHPRSRTAGFWGAIVGPKNLVTPAHFISSPRPMPRRKKHPRMNYESPSCQKTSLRTILSLANRNHKKEKRHALKDSLPGRPKQKGLTQ